MKRRLMMTAGILAILPALAYAEAPVVSTPGATGQVAPSAAAAAKSGSGIASAAQVDTPTYAKKAAMGDMFEIESSKLALEKSKSADVKNFATMMVSGHTKTTEELKSNIKAENIDVTLPTKLDAEHAAKLTTLEGLSGAEFDKAYMDAQIEGHRTALKLHQGYVASGDNPALKTWAGKTAETVQMHLTKAEDIGKKVEES